MTSTTNDNLAIIYAKGILFFPSFEYFLESFFPTEFGVIISSDEVSIATNEAVCLCCVYCVYACTYVCNIYLAKEAVLREVDGLTHHDQRACQWWIGGYV